MRIIPSLNPISKRNLDVQTATENYNFKHEKYKVHKRLNINDQATQNSSQQSSCIEVSDKPLANIKEKKHLIEESLAESIDDKPQSACIDEEREAMRVKTTRFF
jgi:hypothetical protein